MNLQVEHLHQRPRVAGLIATASIVVPCWVHLIIFKLPGPIHNNWSTKTSHEGPCAQTVYALALKQSLYRYYGAKVHSIWVRGPLGQELQWRLQVP